MFSFLHRRSLIAAPLFLCAAAPAPSEADLSALLKSKTQAFSEAGQAGDAATVARTLDDAVVFTNERGEIGSRQDIVDSISAPPAGAPKRSIAVTDWVLHRQGKDLATATFIDQVTAHVAGQALVLKFQSTETWARRADGWKMIVSHTMNVPQMPAAITLPAAALDEYVGTYRLGTVYTVKIRRDGGELVASVNGGQSTPLKAEAKDVLFTPGALDVRRLIQRDTSGRVTGYINRRDGADLVFTRAG